jgi:hypothetical protein
MKLHLLNLPDDTPALADWLEERLMSDDLAEVVAELTAVFGWEAESGGPSLHEAIGDKLDEALESGLRQLSHPEVGALLRHPLLLLELQEHVLSSGGAYWRGRHFSRQLIESAERGLEPLERYLESDSPFESATQSPRKRVSAQGRPPINRATNRRSPFADFWRQTAWSCLGSAAVALLAVFALESFRGRSPNLAVMQGPEAPAEKSWGWLDKANLFATDSPHDYLHQLANAAGEWFDERPATALGVATRVAEFRQGCTRLQLAEHAPLAEADRQWLRERCRAWASKFDEQLAAVESGADPATVLKAADETVNRLIAAIRGRAEEFNTATSGG